MTLLGTYYRGHDVLTPMPNSFHADRDQVEQMPADVVGGELGQWGAAWPIATPALGWSFSFFLDTRDLVSDFLLWLSYRRGQYAPFWMPTWRRDFQLVDTAGSSDTALIVYATGYPQSGFLTEARRHLAAIIPGGGGYPVTLRRITNAVDNGNGTETLTLESPLGVAIDRHAVLSFLVLVRLADDEATLHWYHPKFAEAELQMIELPRQVEAIA